MDSMDTSTLGKIPKVIHQIWVGPKTPPTLMMNTWRDKNPDFEYICWTDEEIKKRNITFELQSRIDEMEVYNGKADIIRWELMAKYGGIFLDADSVCVEPIDEVLLEKKCFAGFEQETLRMGLLATGTMGFPPNHPLPLNAMEWIRQNPVSQTKTNTMAWRSEIGKKHTS